MTLLQTTPSNYTQLIAELNKRLDLLQTGKMRTQEKTYPHQDWVDTTDRDIVECTRQIAVFEGILAHYAKAA